MSWPAEGETSREISRLRAEIRRLRETLRVMENTVNRVSALEEDARAALEKAEAWKRRTLRMAVQHMTGEGANAVWSCGICGECGSSEENCHTDDCTALSD